MFDESKLIIRPATIDDVEFLATVIIEAEKSSTDKNGTATILRFQRMNIENI